MQPKTNWVYRARPGLGLGGPPGSLRICAPPTAGDLDSVGLRLSDQRRVAVPTLPEHCRVVALSAQIPFCRLINKNSDAVVSTSVGTSDA